MPDRLLQHIAGQRQLVIDLQQQLTSRPALGPESGGQGELEKATFIESVLRGYGYTVERADAADARVDSGLRPNLIVRVPGRQERTVWIIAHMDVVPPGDLSRWSGDPWQTRVEGDRIYGRGVADNQQAIVSALLIAAGLKECAVVPDLSLGIIFASDEETGNTYGIKHLLATRPELFGKQDLVLAPDFAAPEGNQICVSEKSRLWLKVSVTGQQSHAARPQLGRNALVAAAHMIVRIQDELERQYPEQDALFVPSGSTFTPTRHDANVPNINTVPGLDVFYVDCRVLPSYDLQQVQATATSVLEQVAAECGVRVSVEAVQFEPAAPGAQLDSVLVNRLSMAIRRIYQIQPQPVGSGGGTVAGDIREMGLTAVAWAKADSVYHEPDEYVNISNTIGDAQVMACLLFENADG